MSAKPALLSRFVLKGLSNISLYLSRMLTLAAVLLFTHPHTHTHPHAPAQTHTLASYTRSHAHALSFISLKRLHTLPYSITHTQKKVCLSLHLCVCLGEEARKKLYKFIPALSLWGNKGGTVKASEQIYFLLKWK